MKAMGDSSLLCVSDASMLHNWKQKQVKSLYQYLLLSFHSWQCFGMTTGLVFCIWKQKGKNIDCPNLYKAADL